MELRACYPLLSRFYEYDTETASFGGVFGARGNLYLQILHKLNVSFTMEEQSRVGDLIPGGHQIIKYSGCLGRLQANESDIALLAVNLPILGPGLTQGPVIGSEIVMISSAYSMTVNTSDSDIMDSFRSFQPNTWTLIVISYAVILLLTAFIIWSDRNFARSRKRIRQRENLAIYGTLVSCSIEKANTTTNIWSKILADSLKLVCSSMLDHYSSSATIRYNCIQFRIIHFCIIYFGFWITFYFGSMIKTEMVVQKRPITIESYDDLLKREEVQPIFTQATSDKWIFMEADPASAEGRIWQRLIQNFGIQKSVLPTNLVSVKYLAECLVNQTCAFFTSQTYASVILSNFCSISRREKICLDINVLYKAHPRAIEMLSGIMLSSFTAPVLRQRTEFYFKRAFEHDLLAYTYQQAYFTIAPHTGTKSIADCFANRVITKDDHAVTIPKIHHFLTLFKVQVACWTMAAIVLLSEVLRWCHTRRRRRRKEQRNEKTMFSNGQLRHCRWRQVRND